MWSFALAMILGNGIVQGLLYGPIGAFVAEQFPGKVRYTGASLAYQGASVVGAGFTPMIAAGLMIVAGGSAVLVGAFWAGMLVICTIAVLLTKESSRRDLLRPHGRRHDPSTTPTGFHRAANRGP
ncbi:hypothetical protein [Citricoccus alkalitolerans]|uniref:MHS family MFS transporter n=1 Tax=Citricoccus alkalitolerans TaxID=246603 RepID=A0ABV8XUH5_9MICC